MATLRDIRKRLQTAHNIQHITKAMEMVAAARLRRALHKLELFRPYAKHMKEVMASLSFVPQTHLLFESRPVNKRGVVIIAGDKGLCGSYNHNVFSFAEKALAKSPNPELVLIGNRTRDHFHRSKWPIASVWTEWGGKITLEKTRQLSEQLTQWFLSGAVDEVVIVYTHYQNLLTRKVVLEQFLPIPKPQQIEHFTDYLFEPTAEEIHTALLPRYILTRLIEILDEAYVSELAARVTSMKAATKNAEEMIERLTLIRNKVRQAGITKEMLEITAGAEGLK